MRQVNVNMCPYTVVVAECKKHIRSMCARVVKITFPSELQMPEINQQVISWRTQRVQTRVYKILCKNHVSRVGEKNYWNKITNIHQNPSSLWTLSHTIYVAQVNVRALNFMVNVTCSVSIVTIQKCSGTSYTHWHRLHCMHHISASSEVEFWLMLVTLFQ